MAGSDVNFPNQIYPEHFTKASCTGQIKSISKMSQKRTESKEDHAEETGGDCDPSKMSPIFAKIQKRLTRNNKQSKTHPMPY